MPTSSLGCLRCCRSSRLCSSAAGGGDAAADAGEDDDGDGGSTAAAAADSARGKTNQSNLFSEPVTLAGARDFHECAVATTSTPAHEFGHENVKTFYEIGWRNVR